MERTERKCKACDKVFSTKIPKQIYCCSNCSYIADINRKNELKIQSYFKIFERDDFTCVYCGKSSIQDGVKLVLDHIYPRIKGGKSDIINMVTSCHECNNSKLALFLKQEIIIQLWQRNQRLSHRIKLDDYKDLMEYFKLHFRDQW